MTIAVCDDDKIFLNVISDKISRTLDEKQVSHSISAFSSGRDLLCAIETSCFDIIFLDIDMPDINGKQLAHDLRATAKNRFKLVFVSDYYEEVFSTFQYDIESFIPKNRLDEYLADELRRIASMLQSNERAEFAFKYSDDGKSLTAKVYIDDIMCMESQSGDILMHTADKCYKLLGYRFENIKSQFLPYGFADIHRTCFVSLAHISAVEANRVVLKSGKRLPLSRRKKKTVERALFQYVKDKVIK